MSDNGTFNYRWTIRGVDPRLIRRLRIEALEQGRPIAQLVNEALAEWLKRYAGPVLR